MHAFLYPRAFYFHIKEQDEAEPMVDDDVPESESPTRVLEGTAPEISQYHNSQSYGGTSSGADQSEPVQSSPGRDTLKALSEGVRNPRVYLVNCTVLFS